MLPIAERSNRRGPLPGLIIVSLLSIGGTLLPAAEADGDPSQASPGSRQTKVNITPRARPVETAGAIPESGVILRVDTIVVLIPVTITDPSGRFVTGLERENFVLTEDKVVQQIANLSSEDAPLSVGIVFDTSGSMGDKLRKAGQAVAQFLKLANPEDEFFLVQFSDRPRLAVPFTSDTEVIQNSLNVFQSKGRTALLDGVYLAMREMKRARNGRRAILIISDGGDNSSRYSEREVRNAVREANVQIYAIGIFEPAGWTTLEEMYGPGLLGEIADQTGGRHFPAASVAELPDIAGKIGLELRNQYVLSYTPKNSTRDGKYRRVQVRLMKMIGLPPLNAAFRRGYYYSVTP